MKIHTQFLDKEMPYTGSELRPHFLLSEFKIRGSAMAAWIGSCDVKTSEMVDWEDRLNADFILAKKMVHFIGEFFGWTLREGVLFQRLMTSIFVEELGGKVKRSGDDLFFENQKLSVSIVTASPVSVLMHFGINIDPEGAPVDAIGLDKMGIDPKVFSCRVLERIDDELQSIDWACTKVRPVL